MGVVYQARQVNLNRVVALKMILAGRLATEADVRRFYLEAEAAAGLDHPGIVPIFEVGQHEGQHYFSMGFVEGRSLAQKVANGPLPPREAAALLVKVAEAVAYAHRRGVIHRDIKPANILLDQNGNPRVTDFGLAKKLEGDSGLTGSGQIMGTPGYMPPEQAGGNRGEVGPASDVYALGATLYALMTGRPPFQAATAMDTVIQVIRDEPVPPRRLNASIPLDLETISLKCMEKEPAKRYASVAALGEDLRRCLAGEPILARPASRYEKAWKWARRRPTIAALSALVVAVALIGLAGILFQWRQAVLAREQAVEKAEAETKARKEATDLAGRLERKTDELERQTYIFATSLAQREWEAANLDQANHLLEACPVRLRGWEWFRLNRLSHLPERTIPAGGFAFPFLTWNLDGTLLTSEGVGGGAQINAPDATEPLRLKIPEVYRATWGRRDNRLLVFRKDSSLAWVEPNSGAVTKLWSIPSPSEQIKFALMDMTLSHDGKLLATAHAGNQTNLRIWDMASGRLEKSLVGSGLGQVLAVAWHPTGRRLAIGSSNWTAHIWDMAGPTMGAVLRGHRGEVRAVAWSPDGRGLATASDDRTSRIWDPGSGKAIATLTGHTAEVNGVAWSPDGNRMATASSDRTVRLWNPVTGAPLATLRGHSDRVFRVAWRPDGSRLASSGMEGAVNIWDPDKPGETLDLTAHPADVRAVAWSPDGRLVATVADDPLVRLWEADTGRPVRNFAGHTARVFAVCFSPDGKRLATAATDLTAKAWDVATGKCLSTFTNHQQHVYAVSWSPDSKLVATGGTDVMVRVWDPNTGKERRSVVPMAEPRMGYVSGVAWSPDGTRIAAAMAPPVNAVVVVDAVNLRTVLKLSGHGHGVSAVAWSADSRLLASASYDKSCRVWDAVSGVLQATLTGHGGFVHSVAWNPDGTRVATAGADGIVRIWDPAQATHMASLPAHTGPVWSIAWSPDGTRLASASADHSCRIWFGGSPAQAIASSPAEHAPRTQRPVTEQTAGSSGKALAQPRSLLGQKVTQAPEPSIRVEFRRAEGQARPGYSKRKVERENHSVFVHDEADFVVTAADLDKVQVEPDEREFPSVVVFFSKSGAERLGRLTSSQVDKPLAILVDGKLVAAPMLRSRLDRSAIISGQFTREEAESLAAAMRPR
jgi:WD40 repeat protein